MEKRKQHIFLLSLIILISCLTSAPAQVGSPQVPETSNPAATQSNPTVTNPVQTVEPIILPTAPPPKKRRRRLTALDSMRLAAQRDSIARVAQGIANNNSAFNINPTGTTATQSGVDTTANRAAATSEVPILENSNNPFEILRGATTPIDTNTVKTKTMLEQAAPSLLSRETYSKNFLFWVFLITLSLMAVVVANGRSSLRDAFQALVSNNALRQVYRLQSGWGNIAQLALYGLFLLNASIFVFLMVYHFYGKPPMNQFWTFLFCILGVSAAF